MIKHIETQPGITVSCVPGAKINELYSKINEFDLLKRHRGIYIIHAGTNNLSSEQACVDSAIAEMKVLCCQIKDHCPHAIIGISGVVYRKVGFYLEDKEKVHELNKKIFAYNEKLQYYCLFMGYYMIKNRSIHSGMVGHDGLHLNRIGSAKLSVYFSDFMKQHAKPSKDDLGLVTDDDFPPLPPASDPDFVVAKK